MEAIEEVEGIVRRLMARPPAVGLSPEWDFALITRDLTTQLHRGKEVGMEVIARRLPAATTAGVVRIELPPTNSSEGPVVPRVFARIEEGRISRVWHSVNAR